jgi:endonuclease/exonuclease/phosphatase (EEP) superfamily protein YafD
MGGALFLCLAYLPPPGSVFWSRGAHEADVFQELEDDIVEAKLAGEVLIAGDLNARIRVEKDWVDTSDIEYHAGVGSPDVGFQLASFSARKDAQQTRQLTLMVECFCSCSEGLD